MTSNKDGNYQIDALKTDKDIKKKKLLEFKNVYKLKHRIQRRGLIADYIQWGKE